ncbi:hypothetical protein A3F29_00445 [Candidatus Roizmanbacteria bacterium RIFCSPHIGHO2_12_FULL_33_9]|uniref:Membrane protein 6-pyruvoyl-tetrahydropterin synthase-related domain-containing protein n=1 Tax=Candidatus Roizmanbacteria bacterium RIFCSPHIGHO2_12_FULL_33_9 TaxID=1802045 RepID=A0A1F7HGU5_9BACT|nr:MAG: hypothetical protein A3F29_00445 [Candidatus Roizmanbacteria bacterium RIFCSPHIGHO2_12_FULL_33_9]
MGKKYLIAFIIFIFAFAAGFQLLKPGLIPTHDAEYHIVRFYQFDKAIRDGNLYPRWAPDLNYGFGVPLFNYVYPLPNYLSFMTHLFGISFINSFKLIMFLSFVMGGIFFYFWARDFWGDLGGLVSSIVFLYSPYFFVDIYIRGSIGEVIALSLFPGVLWSVNQALIQERFSFVPLSGIFLALVIFSHNILGFAFFIFLIFYILAIFYLFNKRKIILMESLKIILLGLGLSAIFWIPAIFERNYVRGLEIFDLKRNFAELYQLVIPSWGSGFFGGGTNEMSVQIGIMNLLAIFISVFVLIKLKLKKKERKAGLITYFLVCFLILFILMTKFSSPVWDFVPFLNFFQFPWRLLSLTILVASFLSGSLFIISKSKILAFIIIAGAFFLGIGYTRPAYYHQREDSHYFTRSNFMDGTNSPGNVFNTKWMKWPLKREKEKIEFKDKSARILNSMIKSSRYVLEVSLRKETTMFVNTAYFPGWKVYVDSKSFPVGIERNGSMSVNLPKGTHSIEAKLEDTPIRNISKIISILSFFLIVFIFYKNFNPRNI